MAAADAISPNDVMTQGSTVVEPPLTGQALYDADSALSTAWRVWFAYLLVPFAFFMAVIWKLASVNLANTQSMQQASTHSSQYWFIATMVYMALAIPGAFFWRSRLFAGYWKGQHVHPKEYLVGMISIWTAIEVGGILALIGCIATGTLLPNLLPAMLAFMLFTPLWPNGHAMTRPLAKEQDPGEYEDPR